MIALVDLFRELIRRINESKNMNVWFGKIDSRLSGIGVLPE